MTKHTNDISLLQCTPSNQSLSCILNFKPLFVTILFCFSIISSPFSPRGRFVLQTEILGKFIITFQLFYFLPLPPLGSVCRLYLTFSINVYTRCHNTSLPRSRSLSRHATLLPTNGCSHANNIPFPLFLRSNEGVSKLRMT